MISTVLIAIVALLHVYFMILEMLLWTKPFGLKTFRMTQEVANSSKVLAANQGLYNGFLAAGLFWSLLAPEALAPSLKIFFLSCVVVAGLFGGATVNRKIFFIQGLPALVALLLCLCFKCIVTSH